jgi:hypothetical protein
MAIIGYDPRAERRSMLGSGLMGAGAALMGQGPTRYPTNILTQLGQGMQGFNQGLDTGRERYSNILEAQDKQQDRLKKQKADEQIEKLLADPNIDDEMKGFIAANPDVAIKALIESKTTKPDMTTDERNYLRAKKDPEYDAFLTKHNPPNVAIDLTPGDKIDSEVAARTAQAEKMGLRPEDPAYKSWVLTGRMPREDQSPLTATDKQAILEADERVMTTDNADKLLDEALRLSKTAYDGPTANERAWTMSWGGGSEASHATQELKIVATQNALESLKATFGAAPTEGERKILLEVQGSAELPQKVREDIYRRAKQLVARRRQFYKERAEKMRGQEYYKPGGAPDLSGVGTGVESMSDEELLNALSGR